MKEKLQLDAPRLSVLVMPFCEATRKDKQRKKRKRTIRKSNSCPL